MPIPRAKRVTFNPHPLVEVVTQFVFPRLLELDVELPVQFQKSIQSEFPILEAGKVIEVTVDLDKGGALRTPPEGRRFQFFTMDRKWQAVLSIILSRLRHLTMSTGKVFIGGHCFF